MGNTYQIGQKVQIYISEGLTHYGKIEKLNSGYPLYSKELLKVSDIADPVNIEQIEPLENWVSIDGLYRAGYNAHCGTSFSPEIRAEQCVRDHEEELNNDLKNMPDEEKERYIEGYKKRLFAWLSAKSRCLSSMITGPANFPVRRNEKANNSEHNRSVEFTEWREKNLKYIAKKVEESKPQEVKDSERFNDLKKQVDRLFEGWMPTRFKSRLETVAKSGNTELVAKVLEYIKFIQVEKNRVLFTPRNSIWLLANVAEVIREKEVDKETAESKEYQISGVKVVENIQADRIQLFFDGKPEYKVISELKHAAFKWSPSNMCWQRQLTNNARYAAERLLKQI